MKEIIVLISILFTLHSQQNCWNISLGSSFGADGNDVIQLTDGNILVGGVKRIKDGFDVGKAFSSVIKLDPTDGDIIWDKLYGEGDVEKVIDNGEDYLIAGSTTYNGDGCTYIIKINQNGDSLDTKYYDIYLRDFKKLSDGSFILGGSRDQLACMIKISPDGEVLETVYDEQLLPEKNIYSIASNTDGFTVVAGGYPEFRVIKFNVDVSIAWDTTFNNSEYISKHKIVGNNNFTYISGESRDEEGIPFTLFLVKLVNEGELLWEKKYNYNYHILDMKFTHNKEDIIIVNQINDFIKIDSNGNEIFNKNYLINNTYYNALTTISDGYFVATGNTHEEVDNLKSPNDRILISKLDSECNGGIVDIDEVAPKSSEIISAYPNPFNPTTSLQFNLDKKGSYSIVVYNLNGSEIYRESINMVSGSNSITFDGSKLSSGIYNVQLVGSEGVVDTHKITLMK